jgi:hypothetical protein
VHQIVRGVRPVNGVKSGSRSISLTDLWGALFFLPSSSHSPSLSSPYDVVPPHTTLTLT